ncbi:hypothetical protein EDD53_0925 [Pacificibacter maritimus]|uniref:Uncharacterized protein n=1 Tax=Pacificibacter maritimus TaxID=762213 RepID=A0A3N4V3V9_9RHOB|nr:hypothetical protein EDD53_0925 [Pacificibacter maritimus]
MQGLVLWYDRTRNKAIVWCDDCDKLAYASATDILIEEHQSLKVGDLVCFDLITFGDFRGCTNLRLVEEQRAPHISHDLINAAPRYQAVANS